MNAIQIKYLPPDDPFKKGQIKVFMKGNGTSMILPMLYEMSNKDRAIDAAQALILKLRLNVQITGQGLLPNGDYVVTIDEYNKVVKK